MPNAAPGGLPTPAWLKFWPEDLPDHAVECLYGGEPEYGGWIDTKGGGGIWDEVKRPYLPAITAWRGPDEAYKHKIPLMLDAFTSPDGDAPEDIEELCQRIDHMAGTYPGAPKLDEPPLLCLDGHGALPYDYTYDSSIRWVIKEPPEWGEAIRVHNHHDPAKNGRRVRQFVTVTFMVHTSSDDIRRQNHSSSRLHRKVTHAHSGDNYETVARRVWHGKHNDWGTRLARLNGHNNARFKLLAGQVVQLPTPDEERAWKHGRRR